MKTLTTLVNLFTNLTNNTSDANAALGQQLISDQCRYLLQKYFDNEREYQTTTVGAMSLTATGALSAGATTATLTVSWAYPTCSQLVTFSDGDQRTVQFVNGSATVSWTGGLLVNCTDVLTTAGVQDYAIPANISKITSSYISVGQLRFVPVPILTRVDWDRVNFLPYSSDIVNYAYIYNGTMRFWPIPSATGNIIQFNYKARIPELSIADYSTGTITSAPVEGITITGLNTGWNTGGEFPLDTEVSYLSLYLRLNPPKGDGIWYPIRQFNSDTSLTLALPIGRSADGQPLSAPFTDSFSSSNTGGSIPNGTYYYVVTAVNDTGYDSPLSSQEVTVITGSNSGEVTLTWFAVDGAVSYRIYRSSVSGDYTDSIVATTDSLSYVDDGTNSTIGSPNFFSVEYTIGQLPILQEDFHDMLVYGALLVYFSSIVSDDTKYKQFENMYNSRLILLEEYAGTKQVSVDLEAEPNYQNPNNYFYAQP